MFLQPAHSTKGLGIVVRSYRLFKAQHHVNDQTAHQPTKGEYSRGINDSDSIKHEQVRSAATCLCRNELPDGSKPSFITCLVCLKA